MTIRRGDIEGIYHAVETVVGANAGQNAGVWGIDAIWGWGALVNRTYYVIVNRYSVAPNPFVVIQINFTPHSSPGFTAVALGAPVATARAALTAAVTAFAGLTGVTESTPVGPLAW
jgi:hypothetical protein